jgi:hypothetical protein
VCVSGKKLQRGLHLGKYCYSQVWIPYTFHLLSKNLKIKIYVTAHNYKLHTSQRLRWSRGCVLAFGTQVRGFKPGRSRRIFQGEKIPSTRSFGGEVKPAVPCRRFTACKRTLNVSWKSAFRQNSRLFFLAH